MPVSRLGPAASNSAWHPVELVRIFRAFPYPFQQASPGKVAVPEGEVLLGELVYELVGCEQRGKGSKENDPAWSASPLPGEACGVLSTAMLEASAFSSSPRGTRVEVGGFHRFGVADRVA